MVCRADYQQSPDSYLQAKGQTKSSRLTNCEDNNQTCDQTTCLLAPPATVAHLENLNLTRRIDSDSEVVKSERQAADPSFVGDSYRGLPIGAALGHLRYRRKRHEIVAKSSCRPLQHLSALLRLANILS